MDKNVNSKAVTSLTSPLHYLTPQQKIFVDRIVKGSAPNTAARAAGYSTPESQGYSILKSPKVQDAIRFLYRKYERASDMTRKKVMDGFLEAVEMAKIQAVPSDMIAGWREIAKMCGYYAPEVKKIEINVTTRRVIDQMETLSDDDLLQMVAESTKLIEGEAMNVLEVLDEARQSSQV